MNCRHEKFEIVQVIRTSGAPDLRRECLDCGHLSNGVRHDAVSNVAALRVAQDYRLTVPPCCVCGVRGVELHHWAPRVLFPNEYDIWPTAWLCPKCHARWHNTMRTA